MPQTRNEAWHHPDGTTVVGQWIYPPKVIQIQAYDGGPLRTPLGIVPASVVVEAAEQGKGITVFPGNDPPRYEIVDENYGWAKEPQ